MTQTNGIAVGACTLFALMCLASGCSRQKSPVSEKVATDRLREVVHFPAEVVVKDRLSRAISFKQAPQKIVSLSPSTTELLFAIGVGPTLIGATSNCNYPPEALLVPRVGGGTLEGISRETLVGLEPDLVLCKWDNHEPLIGLLERAGIPVVAMGPETLDELFDEARMLGRITGHESDANALIQSMTDRLKSLLARVKSIPVGDERRVFYEVWDDPLMTAGPKSFIGEMIRIGRMENIFEDAQVRYPRVSSEAVLARNPEFVLAPSTHGEKVEFSKLSARPGWSIMTAVAKKQVYLIDGDQISRCGPRLLDALEQMLDAVYPLNKPVEVPST